MAYKFYGSDTPSVKPINPDFKNVKDQRHLYDLMSNIWCEYSCAPRYRKEWSKDNMTVGQCSITSFLIQDKLLEQRLLQAADYRMRVQSQIFHPRA